MMWGPGVARAAADLAVHGSTDLLDVTDLGLDRFDETAAAGWPPTRSPCLPAEDPP